MPFKAANRRSGIEDATFILGGHVQQTRRTRRGGLRRQVAADGTASGQGSRKIVLCYDRLVSCFFYNERGSRRRGSEFGGKFTFVNS